MKFLIAGFGSTGRRHLRNLQALGQREIVVYRTRRSTLPLDELVGLPVEYDLEAALAHKPDAVLVCNPTALHLEVAVPAAEAGCHLFIEKPVADSCQGVEALRRALARGGGRLLVGFQFRFHPGLRQAARLITEGALGEVVSASARWGEYLPDWHPWEDFRGSYAARADLGGGVVRTLCHPFDYLRWLVGEVESLWASTAKRSGWGLEVEDTAEIGLNFAGGALGSVRLDYLRRPPLHTLEITGMQGTLTWDNADGAARLYRAGAADPEVLAPPPGFERNHLFLAEMEHFLQVVQGQAEPVCTLEDGLRALEIAEGALRSAETGALVRFDHGRMPEC